MPERALGDLLVRQFLVRVGDIGVSEIVNLAYALKKLARTVHAE